MTRARQSALTLVQVEVQVQDAHRLIIDRDNMPALTTKRAPQGAAKHASGPVPYETTLKDF